MSRSYEAVDLVKLPTLDARGAHALTTALLAAAERVGVIPAHLAKSRNNLVARHRELQAAMAANPETSTGDPQRAVRADRAVDAAWSVLHGVSEAWARLPGDPLPREAEQAQRIQRELFPDGLKFTKLPYKEQWAAGDTLLQRISNQHLDQDIKQLGGETILRVLQQAHTEYGLATGITQAQDAAPASVSLLEPLQGVRDALRAYVLKVSASAEPDDPASQQVVDNLLRPLTTWESSATKTTDAPAA